MTTASILTRDIVQDILAKSQTTLIEAGELAPLLFWTSDLAGEMQDRGFQIGVDAMRRILFDELGLSRRQAFKDEAACHFPQRDDQFRFIDKLRALYERRHWPVLSIDTKKKEILGNFFHPGRAFTSARKSDHTDPGNTTTRESTNMGSLGTAKSNQPPQCSASTCPA